MVGCTSGGERRPGGEPAVGPGDHVLAPHQPCVGLDAVGDQLGVLHAYIELPSPGSADETRFVYLSPQTREIVGYTAEELIADPSHLGRMLHPDDRDRVISLNDWCERTGQPFDSEYRVIAKDGTVVWLDHRARFTAWAGTGSRGSG